jgi:hypothetical protein
MFLFQIGLVQQRLFFFQHEVVGNVGEQAGEEVVMGLRFLFLLGVADLGLYPQQLRDQVVLVVGTRWQIRDHKSEVRGAGQFCINLFVFLPAVVPQQFQ